MFEVAFQGFNLGAESSSFAGVGFLGLVDSVDSSVQYTPEGGGIKGRNIVEEGV